MAQPTDQEKYPEAFVIDQNIDPRTRQRTVPMQVLALGMPRTGTASMHAALEILGYPTCHWFSIWSNIADVKMWYEAAEAKFFPAQGSPKPFGRAEFDQLLGHYAAVCDAPFIAFAPELIKAYPDAVVVLVERDIEAWYKSFDTAVIVNLFSPVLQAIAKLDVGFLHQLSRTMKLVIKGYWKASTKQELRENARAVYRKHYDTIRQITPPERLLNLDLRDGWEPLCKFLGKPIPDCPFPRVNDSEAMQGRVKVIMRRRVNVLLQRAVVPGGLIGVVLAGIYWYKK